MNISLTDPILTAIATGLIDDQDNLPVPVKLPPTPDASPVTMRRVGNLALFKVGELPNGTPIEVQVPIIGGQVVFFPERCASQRQVLAMLGIDVA